MRNHKYGDSGIIVNTTGVPSAAMDAFGLFPNPSSRGIIEVKYREAGSLCLYDMTGRMVGRYHLPTIALNKLTVKLNGLSSGVYQYRYVADNGASKCGKLVIEE